MLFHLKQNFKSSFYVILFFQLVIWIKRYLNLGVIDQSYYFFSLGYVYKNIMFFLVIWVSSSLISFIKDIK